jgi:hypothetical protein
VLTDFFDADDLHCLVFERDHHPCAPDQRNSVLACPIAFQRVELERRKPAEVCGTLAVGKNPDSLYVPSRDRFPEASNGLFRLFEALAKPLRPKPDVHPLTAAMAFTQRVNTSSRRGRQGVKRPP